MATNKRCPASASLKIRSPKSNWTSRWRSYPFRSAGQTPKTAPATKRLGPLALILTEEEKTLRAVPIYEVVTGGAGVWMLSPLDAATAIPTTTATPSTI